MVIEDQINLMGDNPLIGINDDRLGPRFPDMCEPYDQQWIDRTIKKSPGTQGFGIHKGVFVAVAGPNLETRAEYRFLRMIGADVVGMSTVPETIVAVHCGLKTIGLSVITDMCLPDALQAGQCGRNHRHRQRSGTATTNHRPRHRGRSRSNPHRLKFVAELGRACHDPDFCRINSMFSGSGTRKSSAAQILAVKQGSDFAWQDPDFRKSSDFRYEMEYQSEVFRLPLRNGIPIGSLPTSATKWNTNRKSSDFRYEMEYQSEVFRLPR